MDEMSPIALRKGHVLAAKMHRSFPANAPAYTVGTSVPGEKKSVGFLYVFDILTDPTIADVFGNKRTGYLAFQVVPRGSATHTTRIYQVPAEHNASLGIASYGHKEWDIVLDPAIEMPLIKHPAVEKSFDIDKLDKRGGPSEIVHADLVRHIQDTFGEENIFVRSFHFPHEPERPISVPTLEEEAADIADIFIAQTPDGTAEQAVEPEEIVTPPVIKEPEVEKVVTPEPVQQTDDKVKEPVEDTSPVQKEFKRVSYDINLHLIVQRRTGLLKRLESMALIDLRGGADHNEYESRPLKSQTGEVIKPEGIQTLREAWEFIQSLSETGNEQEIVSKLRNLKGISPHSAQELYNAVTEIYDLLDNLDPNEEVNNEYLESLVIDEELIRLGAKNGGVSVIRHNPRP